jgi:hypothetical protein
MSDFSERHYAQLAQALQNIHPGFDPDTINHVNRLAMFHDVYKEIANMLHRDDSRFDRDKFYNECKPGG